MEAGIQSPDDAHSDSWKTHSGCSRQRLYLFNCYQTLLEIKTKFKKEFEYLAKHDMNIKPGVLFNLKCNLTDLQMIFSH